MDMVDELSYVKIVSIKLKNYLTFRDIFRNIGPPPSEYQITILYAQCVVIVYVHNVSKHNLAR